MAVLRCFSTKKPGFDHEGAELFAEFTELLAVRGLTSVTVYNRYDAEGISPEVWQAAKSGVFSEPPCDYIYEGELPPEAAEPPCRVIAVEALPGQYDQRADSCAACIQLISGGDKPAVRCARVVVLRGEISDEDFARCKSWLINPVESREASLERANTLAEDYPPPEPVRTITGFCGLDRDGLSEQISRYGLSMDADDISFLQDYFKNGERRDPTETELFVLDTYWSDHCRHTTFNTELENAGIADPGVAESFEKYLETRAEVYAGREAPPQSLMDIATVGAKLLKKRGLLPGLETSGEVNACTVKVRAETENGPEDWLLLFKNETHNHPTEIEPFGGAATCLGGAIRDPLSGRAYVYQAMRVTGAADPRAPVSETLPGKLPQRRITKAAAAGYSSYGNQIGIATGLVDELYHPGYMAKRMEIGAVVGAVKAENVLRRTPEPGDIVLVLGGRTGRDGCGGATGSSREHSRDSLELCGAEVQKGNAPEERKLLRLFKNPEVARRIKRCNDFGAGGVSVAIGELAPGLLIDLSALPKKYEGLSGTELAISESQERMAVVVAPEDARFILAAAADENVEATEAALVTDSQRLVMELDGQKIVDLSRAFVDSGGAPKKAAFSVPELGIPDCEFPHVCGGPPARLSALVSDLNFCSKRGLGELFDSSIGAAGVLAPYGGRLQQTPAQVMAAKFPADDGKCETCSVMSYGFDPYLSEENPWLGAIAAVTYSLAKLCAAGCDIKNAYLTFQEYFERLRGDPARWGKPLCALLGALDAQLGFGIAAIGGKDSMSGSFEELDVPPTLVSFAIAPENSKNIISPEFKAPGNGVYLFAAPADGHGRPMYPLLLRSFEAVRDHIRAGRIVSAFALGGGGIGEAAVKMGLGNDIGFELDPMIDIFEICRQNPGAIVAESAVPLPGAVRIGTTLSEPLIRMKNCADTPLERLRERHESALAGVFPTEKAVPGETLCPEYPFRNTARPLRNRDPLAVIPVFPGTNCEYDTARAVLRAGGRARTLLVRNLTPESLAESAKALESAIRSAQMLILPGGFSGGDEPEGSGKFIVSFFKNPGLADAVNGLLQERDGLILGICNGFQALVKLGLVPWGEIRDAAPSSPTLARNAIGSHRSRYVTTKVVSVKSPWLSRCTPGELHTVPISHGEGRFHASGESLARLIENGQIAFQYADLEGNPSMETAFNPAGSVLAIEGITSPDGRVLGKMGHSERTGENVAVNIPGNKFQPIFEGGVDYFRL